MCRESEAQIKWETLYKKLAIWDHEEYTHKYKFVCVYIYIYIYMYICNGVALIGTNENAIALN